MFNDFLNESKISGRDIYNNSIDLEDVFADQYHKLTEVMVKSLKEKLIGKLLFFKISEENGEFRNATVRMRKIVDVKSDNTLSDSNIIFVDENGNEMNIYNTINSHTYYEVDPFIDELKKFIGKDVKFKKTRKFQKDIEVTTSVKDIIIIEDKESKDDQFAIISEKDEIVPLPTFTDINTLDIRISEIDPYGEEDWNS